MTKIQIKTKKYQTKIKKISNQMHYENNNFYIGLEGFRTKGISAMDDNDEKDRYRNSALVFFSTLSANVYMLRILPS